MEARFRAEAFEIWRRMNSWIPFITEANGDHFCVECASGRILYDQHDWFDGFGALASKNGAVAGGSLEDFLKIGLNIPLVPPTTASGSLGEFNR